jgi:ADP-dependent NAD(P)H-hydrate dehydratase / NAD(P)H-hydrate epimerase
MKVLTAAEMREVDRLTSERYAIPSLQLMENAGATIAEYLFGAYPDLRGSEILVLCGKGNNGGDGLVVARRLRERGASPRVLLFADPSSLHGDAAFNLKSWQQGHGELRVVTTKAEWDAARQSLAEAVVVVDALLGTGLKGPVEGLLADVIADVNAASGVPDAPPLQRPQVVAVDIPSGLASDGQDYGGPVVAAHATVTLTAPKLGQIVSSRAACVGKLVVRGIGTPAALLDDDARLKMHWLEPGEFRALPLVRRRDANKGTFGHALIVAGSLGKSGAAVLAGSAALRAGAGLVTVATPSGVLPVVAAGMPELMTAPLFPTESGSAGLANLEYQRFANLAQGKSVLAVGPGLSTHPETQQFIRTIVADTLLPIVLDADGLNAFAGRADELAARRAPLLVITPHPGEMARLLGVSPADVQARRLEVALETAKRWRAHVILKGFHTILATPGGDAFFNTTGNPGMATGGTGDVLTGLLAGLTAEFGAEHWERVLGLGVYLHGLAGDLAAARIGEIPLVASDLIDALPAAFSQLLEERSHARR